MDELQQGVHSAQATIGAKQRAVEGHEERIADTRLSVETNRSEAVDVDITRELLELKATEVSYQASIGVAARVLSASVLDFLR
jgi:flagellar hook-associated protein 3 FlgL